VSHSYDLLVVSNAFDREEDAEKAVEDLNERWFGAEAVNAELSPVTNFREACCRDYEMGECTRGGRRLCNTELV